MKGNNEKALSILKKINGPEKANSIFEEIKMNIAEGLQGSKLSIIESTKGLFQKKYRKIMLVAFIVAVAQMSVGINAVFFYATNIFELTGIGTDASFVQSVWVGIINVLFTLVAIFLIDRVGRRPLLLAGLLGVVISLLVVAYGFNQASYTLTSADLSTLTVDIDRTALSTMIDKTFNSDVEFGRAIVERLGNQEAALYKGEIIKAAGDLNPILLLIGILGFVASFAFSLGPVMWVLLSEIFPNNIRGIAISIVGFTNSMVSWVVVQFFPWQLENFGSVMTFIIYACFGIVALLLLLKLLPETKGKSLEELEAELAS